MISRKTLRHLIPTTVAALGIVAIGCSGGSDAGGPAPANPTAAAPAPGAATPVANGTFAQVVDLGKQRCMPCHSPENRKGRLDITNHESVMTKVVAGDPDGSKIVQEVSGAKPEMPKNAAPLTPEEVKIITEWIKAGAKA